MPKIEKTYLTNKCHNSILAVSKLMTSSRHEMLRHAVQLASIQVVMGQTMFHVCSFKAKNRVHKFDYQKMNIFKSVRSSNK